MRELRSYGSVGEPVGNHRLYPEEPGGETLPPTRLGMPRERSWLICFVFAPRMTSRRRSTLNAAATNQTM